MIELRQRVTVPFPAHEVWTLFEDVEQVVACMPGTELTERVDAATYRGRLTVKLGPISADFEGVANVEMDREGYRGTIKARGSDRRGGSSGEAQLRYALVPDSGGTAIEIAGTVMIAGPLAQFGRTGIMQDVSQKLVAEFAECLRETLAARAAGGSADEEAPPPAPRPPRDVRVLRLLLGVLWQRIVRLVRRIRRGGKEVPTSGAEERGVGQETDMDRGDGR